MILIKCEEYGHNVRNTVTKRHSRLLKVKNQFKKFKKKEYISLFSIQDIEKITSHPIEKSTLLKRTKKYEKSEFINTKY